VIRPKQKRPADRLESIRGPMLLFPGPSGNAGSPPEVIRYRDKETPNPVRARPLAQAS
jgi:hypothetical protein